MVRIWRRNILNSEVLKIKNSVKIYRKDFEDGTFILSKVEYPDGKIERFDYEDDKIDLSYIESFEGFPVEVLSNIEGEFKPYLTGIVGKYEDDMEYEGETTGAFEIELQK